MFPNDPNLVDPALLPAPVAPPTASPVDALLATAITPAAPADHTTDTWTVRLVVLALGLIAFSIVTGSVVLACIGKGPLPDSIQTLGATTVGALGALLASTRSTFTKPAPAADPAAS